MKTLWKWLMAGMALVALYLLLINYTGATNILKTLGSSVSGVYKTLQGR